MDLDRAQASIGVGQDVALAPVDPLARIIALRSPCRSAVRTDWLSGIAAEGLTSGPIRPRSAITSVRWTRFQPPLALPAPEMGIDRLPWRAARVGCQGGRSCSGARHAILV